MRPIPAILFLLTLSGCVLLDVATEGSKVVASQALAPMVKKEIDNSCKLSLEEIKKALKEVEYERDLEKRKHSMVKYRLRQEQLNTDKLRMLLMKSVPKQVETPVKKPKREDDL